MSINDGAVSVAVSTKVRSLMAERRVTGEEVAAKTGLTPQALSRRRTGATVWRIDELDAVADCLGVELEDLIAAAKASTRGQSQMDGRSADPHLVQTGQVSRYAVRDSNPEPADMCSAPARLSRLTLTNPPHESFASHDRAAPLLSLCA